MEDMMKTIIWLSDLIVKHTDGEKQATYFLTVLLIYMFEKWHIDLWILVSALWETKQGEVLAAVCLCVEKNWIDWLAPALMTIADIPWVWAHVIKIEKEEPPKKRTKTNTEKKQDIADFAKKLKKQMEDISQSDWE